ncbi:replication initiation and membrane attachment family protein [Vagococcus carniphilus]|uniref:replication initiation and membrane attachment family protein n=1 Tax=Vagococcus carniphilus TaxID=218144 RepID=UPI002890BE17|nr:DnaD domain protein [Vagococcus carniphilus]MDT2814721.1 DnaD domain protein [Vagococcus carniphilus]MDT2864880.1 DnaD domain protein [Vagococcus carniphilus]
MSEAWEHLKPKDKFSVIRTQYISEMDYMVLNMLYQPIVGTDAIGLLNTLLIMEKVSSKKETQMHSVLLNQLNIGIPSFYAAREKLEAVGLLKSFVKKLDQENHFIYEIQQPLEPSIFLHDDILSLLLIEKLGFQEVEVLSEYFNFKRRDMEDYLEVTKTFMDVFNFNSTHLASHENELQEIKQNVTLKKENEKIPLVTKSFDWIFFNSLIENLHINEEQIEKELKRTIELFHQLYGINELEMFDYVKQSVDYVTNRVIEKDFKQLIYKGYHSRKKQEQSTAAIQNKSELRLTETEKDQLRKNTLRLTGFSDAEIEVIIACDTTPPLIFLKAIKTQKGGFVSDNERWTIEKLKTQSNLPDSVLNVLIHYTLVVQNKASINQNMMMTIANDWAQKKIFSPEDALTQVKELQKEREKPKNKTKKNTYSNRSNSRKETLPEWAKDESNRKETRLSKEEEAFFAEQLNKLTNKPKEGEK